MAYQNPAFYFYHGAREAITVIGFSPHPLTAEEIFDGRQGEPYIFATDFAAADGKAFDIEHEVSAAADAVDTLIVSGHNWNGADITVRAQPSNDVMILQSAVTEATGVPIFRDLTPVVDDRWVVSLLDGAAPGAVVPECSEVFLTTKREMLRGPDPNWEHPWVRSQNQFTNESGVTSTWLKGAARKRFRMTWHALEGADRQILFDLQAQTNDWSEPFWFQPPDDIYPTLLVELERDADWQQDFLSPIGTGTTDEVTLNLIEVLG